MSTFENFLDWMAKLEEEDQLLKSRTVLNMLRDYVFNQN